MTTTTIVDQTNDVNKINAISLHGYDNKRHIRHNDDVNIHLSHSDDVNRR